MSDTVLCFFLLGAAILSALRGAVAPSRLLGGTAALLGAVYWTASMNGVWFSLHRLFPQLSANLLAPIWGIQIRTAGLTAVVILLLGITVMLLASSRPSKMALNIAALLATVVTTIGVLGCLTLLAGIWDQYSWSEYLLAMALPSAPCARW